jgi:hypothetical protein
MNDVAKVLNAAADRIERDGWEREGARGPGGAVCPILAICEAGDHRDDLSTRERYELSAAALTALRAYLGFPYIADWNSRRTAPEPVIAALRAAAQAVKE